MRKTVLDDAKKIVYSDREEDYGHPLINHLTTAALWCIRKNTHFTPVDICFMNIDQKMSRSYNKVTKDTLVDIPGYILNIERIMYEDIDHLSTEELQYIERLIKVINIFKED